MNIGGGEVEGGELFTELIHGYPIGLVHRSKSGAPSFAQGSTRPGRCKVRGPFGRESFRKEERARVRVSCLWPLTADREAAATCEYRADGGDRGHRAGLG
jgi:hypothetical protein